ncbi:hypothetical protein [Paenibacillus silviterrae]|uniref:hypothetical protein n=1 Tax=Paenibacillus silviterrae TaxID=3242194 RepID=UPI002543B7CA|nr:hypothetical protein [Paenibacillus chinjuensis]
MKKRIHSKSTAPWQKANALLAASLSVAPALFPSAAAAAVDTVPIPIQDVIGLPGESLTLNLDYHFGSSSGTYRLAAMDGDTAKAVVSGSRLNVYLQHPGLTTFTVTLDGSSKSDVFQVRVMDIGSDHRYDVGDLVKFMFDNPGVVQDRTAVTRLTGRISGQTAHENHPPVPVQAQYIVNSYNGSYFNSISSWFQDADGDTLQYDVSVVAPSSGLDAYIAGDSLFVNGALSQDGVLLIYARDGKGGYSQVMLTLKPVVTSPVNHPPTVTNVTYSVYAPAGEVPAPFHLMQLFHDADEDPLTFNVNSSTPGAPPASISGSYLTFSGAVSGVATYSISATDGKSDPVTASLILTPDSAANLPPVAAQSSISGYYTVNETASQSILLYSNFSDPEHGSLTFEVNPPTSNGVSAFVSGGMLSLSGPGSAGATASFLVTATDPVGQSVSADYHFKVNRKPTVTQSTYEVYLPSHLSVPSTELDLTELFADPDEDGLTFEIDYSNSYLPSSGFGAYVDGGKLSYYGKLNGATYYARIHASDGKGGEIYSDYIFQPKPNTAPTFHYPNSSQNIYYTVGDEVTFGIAGDFTDEDGQALEYSVSLPTSSGITASINASNELELHGDTSSPTVDMTITATDPFGLQATGNYTVYVNHAPTVSDDEEAVYYNGSLTTFDLFGYFADADASYGQALTFTVTPSNSYGVSASIHSGVLYLNNEPTQAATFTVTLQDASPFNKQASMDFTLLPNQTPVLKMASSYKVDTDGNNWPANGTLPPTGYIVDLTNAFADPDSGDTLKYSVSVKEPKVTTNNGHDWLTVTGNADHPGLYVISTGSVNTGTAQIEITATDRDGKGRAATGTVSFIKDALPVKPANEQNMASIEEKLITNLAGQYGFPPDTTFQVISSNSSLVSATMVGNDLKLKTIGGTGTAYITIVGTTGNLVLGFIDEITVIVGSGSS